MHRCTTATVLLLLLLLLCQHTFGKNCRVDETIDWEDPNNIYTCITERKCCTEDGKPACCSEMDEQEAIMRQVKLWGGVIGVILLFGLLMWYARWDGQCCDEDTKCFSCCCKSKPAPSLKAQNMGQPLGLGVDAIPKNKDSSRDLLIQENETY